MIIGALDPGMNAGASRALGDKLNSAMVNDNLDSAATVFVDEIETMLASIQDITKRNLIKEKIKSLL